MECVEILDKNPSRLFQQITLKEVVKSFVTK